MVGLSPTVEFAVNAVLKGGCVSLVENLSPKIELSLQAVVTPQVRLQGSCASAGEYSACLEMRYHVRSLRNFYQALDGKEEFIVTAESGPNADELSEAAVGPAWRDDG